MRCNTPLYDRNCACGWQAVDVWEAVYTPARACPQCGGDTQRAWLSKPPMVVGDECDFVQRNGLKEPRRFRSKQEHRRWLKANGYVVNDAHVGVPGSDKSPHTTSWAATYDPDTAANVKILIERAFTSVTVDEPPLHMHIRTDVHDMDAEEVKRYVR